YIDQSQSLNLFMESPTIGKLSSMYMHAWKQGIKTTYYLRSRPATRINKTIGGAGGNGNGSGPGDGGQPTPLPVKGSDDGAAAEPAAAKEYTDEEALACSLENPESCEACQ